MAQLERQVQLRDYWLILKRRSRIIWICTVVVMIFGGAMTFTQPPAYEAECRLMVTTPYTPYESMLMGDLAFNSRGRTAETQMQVMGSLPIATVALQDLKSKKSIRTGKNIISPKMTAEDLLGMVRVSNVKESDIILLTVEAEDPELAKTVADAFADAYIKDCTTSSRSTAKSAADFVAGQVKLRHEELARAEDAIRGFKQKLHFFSVESEAGERFRLRESARVERNKAESNLIMFQQRLGVLKAKLAEQPDVPMVSTTQGPNPVAAQYSAEIAQMKLARQAALQIYTPEHPKVKAIDARIAEASANLAKESPTTEFGRSLTFNSIRENLASTIRTNESELAAARSEMAFWTNIANTADQNTLVLPDAQETLQRLERTRSVAERSYLAMLERLENYRVAEVTQVNTGRIIDYATLPDSPVRPKKKLNMMFSLILGLLLGIGIAVLIDTIDDTMKSGEDVQRHLGLATLGLIPLAERDQSTLISPTQMGSMRGEAFRMLRSNIAFTALEAPVKTLLVASAKRGEGKTTVSYNLAVAMSLEGKRVILVDADLRRPRLHQLVGVQNHTGITGILMDNVTLDEALVNTEIDGLQFLASGALPPNPAELLGSRRMQALIEQLKARADVVIFDAPPCTAVADAAVLSSIVDATVLVISSTSPNRDAVLYAQGLLQKAMARVLGVVLNKVSLGNYGYEFFYLYTGNESDIQLRSGGLGAAKNRILPPR